MKPYHVETLKAIALLGGMKEYVNLSSGELGKLIGVSQQSASQRILELIRDGLVARDLATRRQRIRLTPGVAKSCGKNTRTISASSNSRRR